MNILLVSNGFPPSAYGGVEVYTYDLAQALLRRGHRVCVFCREADQALEDCHVQDGILDGVRVIRVVNDYKKIDTFRQTFVDARVEMIFESFLAELTPQVIHFNHLIALSARLPLIAARQGFACLVTLHDYWPICHRVNLIDSRGRACGGPLQGADCPTCMLGPEPKNLSTAILRAGKKVTPPGFRRWLKDALRREGLPPVLEAPSYQQAFAERFAIFRETILSTQRLLAPSEFLRTQFKQNGYPVDRIEVVPLSIKVNRLGEKKAPARARCLHLAFIGSLIPIKGADVLIQAMRGLPNVDLRLSLYGRQDIQPRRYMMDIKKMAEGDHRIQFMGPFSPEQREAIFTSIDVLVIPSKAPETFSLVAHEALALGKPVIAAAVGALPEVVLDGVNGFLFPPGDVARLKEILLEITEQPERLASLDCPGPVTIMSPEEHVERMEKIYESLV